MRYSEIYIPTQKEAPQDAEAASHKLLARAGYIRKSGAGDFLLLPLGSKVINKLSGVFQETLKNSSFQEVHWRMAENSEAPFKLLGSDLISYKQLPKKFYGVAEMYSDGIRPRLGMLLPKSFKRLWGIALCSNESEAGLNKAAIDRSFDDVFMRLNLRLDKVESISRYSRSGRDVHYLLPYEAGEHTVVSCPHCSGLSLPDSYPCRSGSGSTEDMLEIEKVHTPNARTIEELVRFFGCTPERFVKTLLYLADNKVIAALVRGDRELSEIKLKELLGCTELVMADYDTVKKVTGAEVGFAGPVGLEACIVADSEVLGMRNFIVGADATDYHLKNVNIGRDFKAQMTGDIRCAVEGDACSCGLRLEFKKGFVLGSLRIYDQCYMDKRELLYRNEQGSMNTMAGLYFEVNLHSLLAAVIEQNHDEAGMLIPGNIAPFDAEIVAVNVKDEFLMSEAEKIYKKVLDTGTDVLLDDRDERAGVKFKDCELIGIPARITIGKRIGDGIVEYKAGRGEVEELAWEEAVARLKALLVLTRPSVI